MTGGHNLQESSDAEYADVATNQKYTTGGQIGAPHDGGCYHPGDYPLKKARCIDGVCNGGKNYGQACTVNDDCPPVAGHDSSIPWGEWEHNHHSGPDDFDDSINPNLPYGITEGSFAFHSGTSSAPDESLIQSIYCADAGWCVHARPAPFKQIFWEGYGVFHNMKVHGSEVDPLPTFERCAEQPVAWSKKGNGKFSDYTLHYYRAHVLDAGEPAGRHQKIYADPNLCSWTPSGFVKDCEFSDPNENFTPIGGTEIPKVSDQHPLCTPATACEPCPDYYEIEIHCTSEPDSPIAYKVGHFIRQGNFQIHPSVGMSCNPGDDLIQ
jgi:hypothetical protein